MTRVKVAAIPTPIPMAIAMAPQWNPETHDPRLPPVTKPITSRAFCDIDLTHGMC